MTGRLSASGALTWVFLLWITALGPIAVFESFDAPLPQGILDGDDDDGAVSGLSNLELKLLALPPLPPPGPFRAVTHVAFAQTEPSALPLPPVAAPSRSPPLA